MYIRRHCPDKRQTPPYLAEGPKLSKDPISLRAGRGPLPRQRCAQRNWGEARGAETMTYILALRLY